MEDRSAQRLKLLAGHLKGNGSSKEGHGDASVAPNLTRGLSMGPENFPQCQTSAQFPNAVHDLLNFDSFLNYEQRAVKEKVRTFMEREVAPIVARYWERAEFPFQLIPKIKQLGVAGLSVNAEGRKGFSLLGAAMIMNEVARVDASLSTFITVHSSLAMLTIEMLGSEEQKRELLPKMWDLDLIGCWALTEPSNGSDASALSTTARKVPGGWVLNGQKRWIGNGTFADVTVVWARNLDTNQVNAFIVRKGTPGFKTAKIENKIALRIVQNADITMTDVFVPDSARLPGVDSFKDTSSVLAVSRIMVAWQPVGIAMGVFDMCVRYLKQRKQFGTPLAAFQLAQERLVRMAGNIQAMFLMCWRLTNLQDMQNMTHGQASMVKAWTTLRGRETVALGRELLGGNGVVVDFHVAKAFCDLEAIYTYEGTYDINALVAGREITGIAAIKSTRK